MENDTRVEPLETAGERETLIGFLDYFRATVHLKAAGLSDADGAKQLLPSLTTVSGLVQHLTDVERLWFQDRIDGQQGVPLRWSAEDPDGEFRVSESDSLVRLLADYEAACGQSREVLARYGLEDRCRGGDKGQSVRWVLVHMIEETSRHCGHLDILRELLDGSTGD
ncbi:DinB family protein [Arthrobacter sp. zg-Y179]|uniref:DinB family protein n=1 Tax=Arthrobacter sp. zg-Y179 TaxID=2894188 RepID=UPI001E32D7B9|nr:DinB family protein [Arthrobacter sp. zg-Y179]MCC9174967.1 DinB family protein [Arthrobacter sp. zg-Y179]